ncbi:MAG: HAD-IIIA family hydrolase [Candidatus Firestonebacteria bacterium]
MEKIMIEKINGYCDKTIKYGLYFFALTCVLSISGMQFGYFPALLAYLVKIIVNWKFNYEKEKLNLFDLAFFVFFFTSFFSCFLGINTLNSLLGMFKSGGWMLLYLVVSNNLKDKKEIKTLIILVIIGSVLGSIYAIYKGTEGIGRLYGGAGHPLSLSAILLFLISLILSLIFFEKKKTIKFILIAVFLLMMVVEILTYVKAGLLAFVFSLIIMAILFKRKKIFVLLLGFIVIIASITIFLPDSTLSITVSKKFNPKFSSNFERLCMWKSGLLIFKNHPLGIGIHNLELIYPKYKLPEAIYPNVGHLHNNFMQIMVERGIYTLFAYIFLIFAFYYVTIKALPTIKEKFEKYIVIGIIGGFSAYLISGIFEYSLSMVILNLWFFIGISIAIIKTREKRIGVFLDRDGTIDVEKGYLSNPDELELIPRSAEAIKLLNELNIPVIVTTNQSGVSRGKFTEKTLKKINKRLQKMLRKSAGAYLNEIYYCIHLTESGCLYRKPNSGMLIKGEKKYNLDLKKSYVIGDKVTDIEFGNKVGAKSILVLTGDGITEKEKLGDNKPVFIAKDLFEAVEWMKGVERIK